MPVNFLTKSMNAHVRDESGGITIMGLFILLLMIVVSAVGLDVASLMAARNQLQISADAAAHRALFERVYGVAGTEKNLAIDIAAMNMPNSRYGDVLQDADIEFGVFDYSTRTFTPDASSNSAVRVTTKRLSSRSNSVASLLFQFVGMEEFDVVAPSIFATYRPNCPDEGMMGVDEVKMTSGNIFTNGFVICSNGHVTVSSGNTFDAGTRVMMPDTNDIVMPNSGFTSSPGLEDSLYPGSFQPLLLNRLPDIIDALADGTYGSLGYVDPIPYLVSNVPVVVTGNNLTEADLAPGYIYVKTCVGNTAVNVKPSSGSAPPFREMVFVTNCRMQSPASVRLEDSILASTNTSSNAMSFAADLHIGRDDNCAVGGGAQILALGGIKMAAQLFMSGGQIVSLQDVSFAAGANGIQGASIISGGTIDSTSGTEMAFCGTGMEGNFALDYFRLAG